MFLCREVMKKIRALAGVFYDNTLIDGEYVSLCCCVVGKGRQIAWGSYNVMPLYQSVDNARPST